MISTTNLNAKFREIQRIPSNRVMPDHVRMVHALSKIRCTLCFQIDPPSTFVRDLMVANSSCKCPFHLLMTPTEY